MTQTRRDLFTALLTLPGIAWALADESSSQHKLATAPRFEEVAGCDMASIVSRCSLAILPLGSLEFHGPHNPVGADSIIISGIAERVADRMRALLFPTIRFTQCPAHTAQFRGTI